MVPYSLFILASSVCKSPQYLTSALTQGGKRGHLFRLTCSVVLRGGRNTANKYHWRVWGALAVSGPHWVCPCSRCVCFPSVHCSGSRLLQGNSLKRALGCVHFPGLSRSGSGSQVLHNGTDSAGPAFCALPGSEQLGECTLSRWAARLITSPVPAARISGCAAGVLSQMCHVSPLGS